MRSKSFFSIILLLLLSSACRDYHITTKINTDGTCERIIRIDSDTHENILKELPFFIDSTWEKKLEKSPKDTTHQVIIFSKIFPDIERLNGEIAKGRQFKSVIKLDKKFRWFYTYYSYTETYPHNNPFKKLRIEDFLTKEDLDTLSSGSSGKRLSKKTEDFLQKCMAEELIDSLSAVMKKHSLYEENKFERIRNLLYSNTAGLHDSLITYIEKIYGPELTPGIKAEIGRIDHNLDDKIESLISPSEKPSLSTSVVLPGLLLNTNAKSIEGNMLTWKPDSDIGLFIDFKMTAESRVTNTWTMIVTGLTAVILVLILLIPYRRGQTTQT